jgi:hypothetical protein
MSFADEPKGWSRLHAMAQNAPDSRSLALIIDEMNRLLDGHQEMADWRFEPYPNMDDPALLVDIQATRQAAE